MTLAALAQYSPTGTSLPPSRVVTGCRSQVVPEMPEVNPVTVLAASRAVGSLAIRYITSRAPASAMLMAPVRCRSEATSSSSCTDSEYQVAPRTKMINDTDMAVAIPIPSSRAKALKRCRILVRFLTVISAAPALI